VLGTSVSFCASASAKMPQTITFTSTPPAIAVAGESYEVSARSSSGLTVDLTVRGACSFSKPQADSEKRFPTDMPPHPPRKRGKPSPQTVYFDAAGTCAIIGESKRAHRISQEVKVARDSSEQLTFTSTAPNNATVGGSYSPSVRSSEGLEVFFSSATPSVCVITRYTAPQGGVGRHVSFIGTGTCTIDASQEEGREEGKVPPEAPEAQQSLTVSAQPSEPATRLTRQRAHEEAEHLLTGLRLPRGAMPVKSDPSVGGRLPIPNKRPGRILADAHGYWRVPGKPEAVIRWIEAHRPTGSTPAVSRDGPRNHVGGGWSGWFASFSFPAQQPGATFELLIAVRAAKSGGTALRVDGQVFVHHTEPTK
jgi:hypothetical protein